MNGGGCAITTHHASVISEHIVLTPGVCAGKPRIAGHRIKVAQVAVRHERMGLSPAEIVAQHPGITLANVHAALAYYQDHLLQIEADVRAGEEAYDRLKSQQLSLLEKIVARQPDVLGLSSATALAYVRSGACPVGDVERLRADLPRRQAASPADHDLAELREELERAPTA